MRLDINKCVSLLLTDGEYKGMTFYRSRKFASDYILFEEDGKILITCGNRTYDAVPSRLQGLKVTNKPDVKTIHACLQANYPEREITRRVTELVDNAVALLEEKKNEKTKL